MPSIATPTGNLTNATARPTAHEVFESWARGQAVREAAIRGYRSMWSTWLRYLARPGVNRAWFRARPADVDGLLETLPRRRGGPRLASHVSRRRYWAVLSRVYEHAKASGWCRSNPTHLANEVPRSEEAAAVVLPPAYLERLRALAEADAEGHGWTELRDRALLALLLDGALTTGELVALDVQQVLGYAPMGIKVLRIDGDRPAQRRDVPLESWSSAVLETWLQVRSRLMGSRSSAGALFVSRKGWAPLRPHTVHQVLQGYVMQLECEFATQIEHRGANLVRSSVVARWLNLGMRESDVLARAGLEDTAALRRLRHAAPRRERPPVR